MARPGLVEADVLEAPLSPRPETELQGEELQPLLPCGCSSTGRGPAAGAGRGGLEDRDAPLLRGGADGAARDSRRSLAAGIGGVVLAAAALSAVVFLCIFSERAPEGAGQRTIAVSRSRSGTPRAAHGLVEKVEPLPPGPGADLAGAAPGGQVVAGLLPDATTTGAAQADPTATTTTGAAQAPTGPDGSGPSTETFYVYRAQSEARYPLENVDVADLAGVLWYLHHEVVPATPRKYHIDRIRRYKLSLKTTREFWNVHHASFAPFFAYDGGRCTTPGCGDFYHQYGFVVGCQFLSPAEGAYLAPAPTTKYCQPGADECRLPLWISLPGPCPAMGIHQHDLKGNMVTLDVSKGKPADCVRRMPGGRCAAPGPPTGAPDCTYNVEDAGEVMLDELAGIADYNQFWNVSFLNCVSDRTAGRRAEPCERNREYSGSTDTGIGNSFWDGKLDKAKCAARLRAVRGLFRKRYPRLPVDLETPLCDFDTVYQDEFTWPANHTGAVKSAWWDQRM